MEQVINHCLKITRFGKHGWGPAGPNAVDIESSMFNFYIDVVDNKYRLSCVSADEDIDDDSLHQTILELKDYAKEIFGVDHSEWKST